MTTPNLGLALAAAPDTIAQALITKFNGNFSTLDTLIGNKVDKGSPITNLITTTAVAGGVPLVAKGILLQSGNLFEARNNVDSVLATINQVGWINAPTINAGVAANDGSVALFSATSSATQKALIIRGAASQSANILEAQNSSGGGLLAINSGGALHVGRTDGGSPVFNGYVSINGPSNTVQLLVRGHTTQSINLQEWQASSGSIIASVSSAGLGFFSSLTTGDHTNPGGSIAVGSSTPFNYGARLEVTSTAVSHRGIVIRGAASQTANLQEIQNSSGTIIGGFSESGLLLHNSGNDAGANRPAGGVYALPATAAGYFPIKTHTGAIRYVPFYN